MIVAVLTSACWLSPAQAANQTITNAVDGFIRPAYRNFADATEKLNPALSTLCQSPSEQSLEGARAAFRQALIAWGEVEIIRIGPVTEENRQDRILHWPDRKGIGLKQVQAALSSEDPTAADAARLAQKSVAMQGLGALEYLVSGTGADDKAAWGDTYRCRYAQAVAGNLSTMAASISKAWDAPNGFAATWENPSPDNTLYRDDAESLTDLLDVFVQGTEMVRDVQLNGFFGASASDDKVKQAIYWRSNGTIDALNANFDGLSKLFEASHIADLATGDESYLGKSIDFQFANAHDSLSSLKGKPVEAILADEKMRQKLSFFRVLTSSLSEMFGTRLSGALKLTAGFSSLDGD
ncbi:peptidase M75, Imelysin [Mesorhizobium denitrificans]|uniref:Peptidase M75, Imelysin n=2 Tax=Phyllobacteriaceae TaxID=69277 RepID=A0A371XKD6_9HYPH|nr:peptidase M75, Imelysin [Mesorhizobium denitrificans]